MKRIVRRTANTLLITVALLLSAAVLLPSALGFQRYVITGASMTGAISKGSVVYAKVVPVDSLKVGDIVTFVPPGDSAPVTHRILGIAAGPGGERVFHTKGDFNDVADPWRVTFIQSSVARYVCHIPYLGYALAALSVRETRLLLIGLPALLVALSLLGSVWRTAGEDMRRHELARSRVRGEYGPAEDEAGA